jgi:hypothetical protein
MPNTRCSRTDRRSRQVRGHRRRNLERAVSRGRLRDGALLEFLDCGGKLDTYEQLRVFRLQCERAKVPLDRKEIDFKFGGVQVKEPMSVMYIDELAGPSRGGKLSAEARPRPDRLRGKSGYAICDDAAFECPRPRVELEFVDNALASFAEVQTEIQTALDGSVVARVSAPADEDLAISSVSVSVGGES